MPACIAHFSHTGTNCSLSSLHFPSRPMVIMPPVTELVLVPWHVEVILVRHRTAGSVTIILADFFLRVRALSDFGLFGSSA